MLSPCQQPWRQRLGQVTMSMSMPRRQVTAQMLLVAIVGFWNVCRGSWCRCTCRGCLQCVGLTICRQGATVQGSNAQHAVSMLSIQKLSHNQQLPKQHMCARLFNITAKAAGIWSSCCSLLIPLLLGVQFSCCGDHSPTPWMAYVLLIDSLKSPTSSFPFPASLPFHACPCRCRG